MSNEERYPRVRLLFPTIALLVGFVVLCAADREYGLFFRPSDHYVNFAHPLSTQLDRMMRSDAEVLVIGDPTFVARTKASEASLGGTVQYLVLPQVDLYAIVAVLPAVLRSEANLIVMESIPSYWSGEVHMAVQPPAAAVEAAIQQVPQTERVPFVPRPQKGRDYIVSPPTQPFDPSEAIRLVFENYNGYWREIDQCLLWVTNDELLDEAQPKFKAAYQAYFSDPAVLHPNIGHVGSLEYAPQLLAECRERMIELYGKEEE